MPCFLVGQAHAEAISQLLRVPLFLCSHQQGHVAAALWSADRLDLMDQPHLAWHLSGGTTELLLVEPQAKNVNCTKIGGTTDISAGQLIDRTGVMLGLQFPAGKQLDALSVTAENKEVFCAKCNEMAFSFSGLQNKIEKFYAEHPNPHEVAGYALRCICATIIKATDNACRQYPDLPIVFSGGVASNAMLRAATAEFSPIFAKPEFSTDNAMGVAILAARSLEG